MVTKDIISKAHAAFRNINPDVWTDLSIYIGQVEYEVVALKAQLAAKEQEDSLDEWQKLGREVKPGDLNMFDGKADDDQIPF